MSLRKLFSNGVVSSIPAVSSADPGQVLTVNEDHELEWIAPGAGPGGPIQGVNGTTGQIISELDDTSGVVTLSFPPNILTTALTLAHDTATATSGYTLPASTEDIAGNQLASGSQYVMQFAAPTADTPGLMTFALAGAGAAGVTSIAPANGITAIPTTGEVSLGLGNITPLSVTSANINATTNLTVGTGDGKYILPTTADTLASGNYVMALTAAVPGTSPATLAFTPQTAAGGGTVTSVSAGYGLNISAGTSNINPTLALNTTINGLASIGTDAITAAGATLANVTATESVTIGEGTNAYKLPVQTAALANNAQYVMKYTAAGNQMAFEVAPVNNPGVQSVASKVDGSVGSGIVVDNTDATNPVLELGNIVPVSVNVKGEYILPTSMTGASAGYAMILPTPLPTDGTVATMTWGPVGGGTGGSGTVENIIAGANISVTGATPTVNPTIAVSSVMTGITSISAGEFTTTPATATNKTFINVNNALVVKSGSATTQGTSLTFSDTDSASGFKCVNNAKGFQVITNIEGTVPPSITPIQVGYILPTAQPTATGQVLAVQTLQVEPTAGDPNPTFTTTEWTNSVASVESPNQLFITTNTSAGAVTLSLPETMNISIPNSITIGTQQFVLGGLLVEQTKAETPIVSNTTTFQVLNNNRGILVEEDGSVQVFVGQSGSPPVQDLYVLPITMPTNGQFLQAGDPVDGKVNCTWADGTASGINAVNGTVNQIATAIESPGAVKLTLSPNIIVPDNSSGLASIQVGQFVASAQTTGTTPDPVVTETTLSVFNPATGDGFIASPTGIKIQVGNGATPPISLGASTYMLPRGLPKYGDIMYCETASDGTTPAACAWGVPLGSTYEATSELTGYTIENPPQEVEFGETTTSQFEINMYQSGATKFIYLDFDAIYTAGGCLNTDTSPTAYIGELHSSNLDISEAQGLQSIILQDGQDMVIGSLYYSTTTQTGDPIVTTAQPAYGLASVVLKRVDLNTLLIRIVLTPKETITVTGSSPVETVTQAFTNKYGIAPGTSFTLSACQNITGLNNQTPSAKCLFTYY